MLEHWYLFPLAIVVSTIAMMSGIGGAVMFGPVFILVAKLEPLAALATALFVEIFGFASGLYGYLRERSVNFHVVKELLPFALGGTVIGALVGKALPGALLSLLLAGLLLYLSYRFLLAKKRCLPKHPHHTGVHSAHHRPDVENTERLTTSLGALLVGMISAGLGEVNEYNFLRRLRLKVPAASGTSVFLVAASATIGVLTHLAYVLATGEGWVFVEVLPVVLFAVPGVVIGAQLGVKLAHHVREDLMGVFAGTLFLLLGTVVILTLL